MVSKITVPLTGAGRFFKRAANMGCSLVLGSCLTLPGCKKESYVTYQGIKFDSQTATYYPDSKQVHCGELLKPAEIQGNRYPERSYACIFKGGGLESIKLSSDTELPGGLHYSGTEIEFHDNGRRKAVHFSRETALDDIACAAPYREIFIFSGPVDITQAKNRIRFPAGSVASFDPKGNATAVDHQFPESPSRQIHNFNLNSPPYQVTPSSPKDHMNYLFRNPGYDRLPDSAGHK
jgi:hypothetical protein